MTRNPIGNSVLRRLKHLLLTLYRPHPCERPVGRRSLWPQ